MTHRILVVDDELSVTDLLAYNLRKHTSGLLISGKIRPCPKVANLELK
jgi:hypothetical protein